MSVFNQTTDYRVQEGKAQNRRKQKKSFSNEEPSGIPVEKPNRVVLVTG